MPTFEPTRLIPFIRKNEWHQPSTLVNRDDFHCSNNSIPLYFFHPEGYIPYRSRSTARPRTALQFKNILGSLLWHQLEDNEILMYSRNFLNLPMHETDTIYSLRSQSYLFNSWLWKITWPTSPFILGIQFPDSLRPQPSHLYIPLVRILMPFSPQKLENHCYVL